MSVTEESSSPAALDAETRTYTPEELAGAARAQGARELEHFASGLRNADVRSLEAHLEKPVDPWTMHAVLMLRGDEDTLSMQVAALVNVLQIGDGYEAWVQLSESLKEGTEGRMSIGQQYEMTLRGLTESNGSAGTLELNLRY